MRSPVASAGQMSIVCMLAVWISFFSCGVTDPGSNQNEEETTGGKRQAPVPAQIIGTWQAQKRIIHDTVYSSEVNIVQDTISLMEITANEIIVVELDFEDRPDTSISVEHSTYSLSGNSILGEEFTGSETDDGYTETYSTTYQKSENQLIITFNVKGQVDQSEGGHTERMQWVEQEVQTFEKWNGEVPPASWSYLPGSNIDLQKSVNASGASNDLVGKWILVKAEEIVTWYEEEIQKINSLDDYYAVVSDDSITLYHGDPDQSDCYEVKHMAYTLDSTRLVGSDFEGSETAEDEFNEWSSSLYFDNSSQLVLELVEKEGVDSKNHNETVYEIEYDTLSYYFRKSDETPPLSDWPTESCEFELMKKQRSSPFGVWGLNTKKKIR